MPQYQFLCKECEVAELVEQPISEDLVPPQCSDHGPMYQDYNFAVGFVKGMDSNTPGRPRLPGKD